MSARSTTGAFVDCPLCHGSGLIMGIGSLRDCGCKNLTQLPAEIHDPEPMSMPSLTGTEGRLFQIMAARQAEGRISYGLTVEDNPMPLKEWLIELRNEMLDGAIYAQKAIEDIEKKERWKDVPAS